jgi:hypothetical protein
LPTHGAATRYYYSLRGSWLFWLIPLGIENETRIDLRVVTNPIEQQATLPGIA